MTVQRHEQPDKHAHDRRLLFRRATPLGLTFVAVDPFLTPSASAAAVDAVVNTSVPLGSGLLVLLSIGISLALLLALPLAMAVARTTDALERRWSSVVTGLAWVVNMVIFLSYLAPGTDRRLGFAAVVYTASVAIIALSALLPARRDGPGSHGSQSLTLPQAVARAALLLWTVGAAWFVMDAFGIAPLGFSPLVVRLTAIHFHYAAFIVPVIAAVVAAAYPSALSRTAAVVSVLGAPSTAIGITAAQLGAPHWVETLFALPMIAGALLVGVVHLGLALGSGGRLFPRSVRVLRLVVGATLLGTMGLAAAYAARGWLPWAPTIPQMALWHGIGNAVGVAFCGLLACWLDPPAPQVPEASTLPGYRHQDLVAP
ncbi:MAG: YndJ family transporter [Anaerolineae bacterium]